MYVKRLVITGYRSYELGIFQENDPKIAIIKKVLTSQIKQFIEEGYQWFLIGGALGVEIWAGQVLIELKKEYAEVNLGIIFPYQDFGHKWNEKNKNQLADLLKDADFVDSVSHSTYQNKTQFQNHTRFLLSHSDGCFLIYDEEFAGKCQSFFEDAIVYKESQNYFIAQITMYDLQNTLLDNGF